MSSDVARQQWTPPPGRHEVNIGKSMTRFLKQRKGIQQTKQNKAMPTSNFYHFKYNFMPESVDTSKPGVVELTTKEITTARVERASHQSDEVHVFRGKEEPAKEVECVLLYDPETGTYTLEKLDSSLILHHEGRGPPKVRQPSASPLPNTPSPSASTSRIEDDPTVELSRELENNLAADTGDDDNEEDIPLSASSRVVASNARKAEPPRPSLPPTSSGKPRPKLRGSTTANTNTTSKPVKPSPLATSLSQTTISTPNPKPATPGIPGRNAQSPDKRKSVPQAQTLDVEEEELEFGQPARQMTRPRASPQPDLSAIALPTASGSSGIALPSSGGIISLPGPVCGQPDDEDDEDEWDEVAAAAAAPGSVNDDDGSIFGDGLAGVEDEEEINVEEFAADLDMELLQGMEEEDGDADADADADGDGDGEMEDMFGDVEEPAHELRPMSLNQFAGGETLGVDDVDDDYSSSSEESDDD